MENKVALITGAGKGIGAACAKLLSTKGYTIALHYRTQSEEINKVTDELKEYKLFQYDLSESSACENLTKSVKKEFGKIDLLINNAGTTLDQIIAFSKPADIIKIIDINFKSICLLTKYISRIMMKQRSGNIINITSIVGHTGNYGQSIYAASKSAITTFNTSIAKELAAFNIRCNCIAPGYIDTNMTKSLTDEIKNNIIKSIPMKRCGKPEEIAEVAAFLSSQQASYITGSTIHVDGGML